MTRYAVYYEACGMREDVALFSDTTPTQCIVDFCDSIFLNAAVCDSVFAIDITTGEVVYDRMSNVEEDEGNFNPYNDCCDYDMGFDPYMGCYTDDC